MTSRLRWRFNKYLVLSPFVEPFKLPCSPKLKGPLLCRLSLSTYTALFILMVYILACWIMFFSLVKPTIEGNSQIRVGADSATYFDVAHDLGDTNNKIPLLTFSANLIGPVVVALLLKDAGLIVMFNMALFLIALYAAKSIRGVRFHIFVVLLILNAETAAAITTLNKEIFALFSLVLLAKYIDSEKKSKLLLAVVFLVSIMARWEQAAIVLLFLLFQTKMFREKPWVSICVLVAGISIAYPLAFHAVDMTGFEEQAEGGNTVVILDKIQAHYGFALAVVPKIIMNCLGVIITPSYYFVTWPKQDLMDLQNQFIVRLHELSMALLIAFAIVRKLLNIYRPVTFFIVIYLIVTASSTFVQSRYEYPVYVLLCLEVARRSGARLEETNPGTVLPRRLPI